MTGLFPVWKIVESNVYIEQQLQEDQQIYIVYAVSADDTTILVESLNKM